jgi:hypothetical protein
MGSRTDAEIECWQQQAGIESTCGARAEILGALSKAAYEAIRIIELERSGIRDGDGYWHGGDVIGGMTGTLTSLCKRLMDNGEAEWCERTPPHYGERDRRPRITDDDDVTDPVPF